MHNNTCIHQWVYESLQAPYVTSIDPTRSLVTGVALGLVGIVLWWESCKYLLAEGTASTAPSSSAILRQHLAPMVVASKLLSDRLRNVAHAQFFGRPYQEGLLRQPDDATVVGEDITARHLECVVCLERPRSVYLRACRHVCLCSQCYTDIWMTSGVVRCPICRIVDH